MLATYLRQNPSSVFSDDATLGIFLFGIFYEGVRLRLLLITCVAITCGFSSGARAYCSAPSMYETEPSVPYGSPPSPPYCLAGYKFSARHDCDSWEIDRFIDEVNAFIASMNAYATEARDFANAAIDYANEAAEYARCQAEEAKNELR